MANLLRDVSVADLAVFFEYQRDPASNLMAAVPARDQDAFEKHWTEKVLGLESVLKKTIVFEGQVAGHLVSWDLDGKRMVGYWIGQEFWGKGLATAALGQFLALLIVRPLYAYVARHNRASIRVLEKHGFVMVKESVFFSKVHGRAIEDAVLALA